MDQTMIDVGHVQGAAVGDEVVLIGRQGENEITLNEVADLTGTIPYDVMCAMGKQVQHRIYIKGKPPARLASESVAGRQPRFIYPRS
jgi:alanine racemase